MNKKALVTGSEGFIGSHMVRFPHAQGWNVIGTYLQDGSTPFPKLPNLEFAQCDLRDGQRITQIVADYQAVKTEFFRLTYRLIQV
jgi:nucleoside-diphosphate-sugar epimerase